MHVVEVPRAGRVQPGQGLGRGRRGREAQQTGRGVDAVTVTTVCPPGSRRAMTRTADRPTGDSDSCLKAVRAWRGAGGSQTCVSSSPGRSLLRPSPVTKSAAGRPRRASAGTAQQHHPVEGAGEGGHRPGGQRQADVPADGGDVVHLERPEERVAALPGERRGGRVARAGPAASGRARRACTSRRPARRRRPPRTGVQPKACRSSSRVTRGCGWENSKVPPPSQASPSRHVASVAGANSVTPFRSTRSVSAVVRARARDHLPMLPQRCYASSLLACAVRHAATTPDSSLAMASAAVIPAHGGKVVGT